MHYYTLNFRRPTPLPDLFLAQTGILVLQNGKELFDHFFFNTHVAACVIILEHPVLYIPRPFSHSVIYVAVQSRRGRLFLAPRCHFHIDWSKTKERGGGEELLRFEILNHARSRREEATKLVATPEAICLNVRPEKEGQTKA